MTGQRAFEQALSVLALLATLVGCGTTQASRFYMLESMAGTPSLERIEAPDQDISVGLGPITFPDYLDRPQIVTRTQQNRVLVAEFDRWAGPLSGNVSRVLAEDLTLLLNTDNVVQYPWPASFEVTYQVMIDCYRFDGVLGDKALLEVQWSVVGKKGRKVLLLKRSAFAEPIGGASYEALVAAQSRALGNLSREMALALKNLVEQKAQE